jgi:hypothetical protein
MLVSLFGIGSFRISLKLRQRILGAMYNMIRHIELLSVDLCGFTQQKTQPFKEEYFTGKHAKGQYATAGQCSVILSRGCA